MARMVKGTKKVARNAGRVGGTSSPGVRQIKKAGGHRKAIETWRGLSAEQRQRYRTASRAGGLTFEGRDIGILGAMRRVRRGRKMTSSGGGGAIARRK